MRRDFTYGLRLSSANARRSSKTARHSSYEDEHGQRNTAAPKICTRAHTYHACHDIAVIVPVPTQCSQNLRLFVRAFVLEK